MKVRIAARGSKLSRIQVTKVEERLKKFGLETEFIEVKTKADLFQNKPLSELGKGVFEKEVNEYVIQNRADLAVHSMKDLLSELPKGLEILAVLPRDPPYDVFISNKNLFDTETKSIIGTSSIRRKNLISFYRKDLIIKDLRGNVDTRINKYLKGEYNAIVLAEASIIRLGLHVSYFRLDPLLITPEANQGIIAVVGKNDNYELKKVLSEINDEHTFGEAIAERSAISVVGGGCHSPVGVLVEKIDENEFYGIITYSDGKKKLTVSGYYKGFPNEVGTRLGKDLLKEMKNEGIVP
ncbi:MAG: hydroxymethylbilane synthase [Sulfolobus sp.]